MFYVLPIEKSDVKLLDKVKQISYSVIHRDKKSPKSTTAPQHSNNPNHSKRAWLVQKTVERSARWLVHHKGEKR